MNRTEELAATMISSGKGGGDAAPASSSEPRKRGRPPGSKNRPKDGTQPEQPASLLSHFVYVPDETSIAASTAIGAVVWSLAAPLMKIRDLHDEERVKLGRALDPVLCRWVPILGEWKYEAALIMLVMGLAQTCRKEYIPKAVQNDASPPDQN